MAYTVLVVDGGGRGSVLVEIYSESPYVSKVLAVPGNDLMGMNSRKPVKIYPYLKTTSIAEILAICQKEKIDLVDVVQDNAVEVGLADALIRSGVKWVVGPTRLAGQIEWDKAWARGFMKKYNILHPNFYIFNSQDKAVEFLKKKKEGRWFVKANGLAEGKGALPAQSNLEAMKRVKEMPRFGKSGETFLIEEWLEGEEFSLFIACDGESYKVIGAAQDHKRMYNFDLGENTGGMGCSSPPLVLTPRLLEEVEREIVKKTLYGLQKEKRDYKGILYLGGIIVDGKIYVIEFNARWGDPEAEVIVPSIRSDFFLLGRAIAEGDLRRYKLKIDKKSRVVVTLAINPDFTGSLEGGLRIYGIEQARELPAIRVYNARIKKLGRNYYAHRGRQMYVAGEGNNVIGARQRAYSAVSLIYIEGNNLHYRTDIGWRDVERLHAK